MWAVEDERQGYPATSIHREDELVEVECWSGRCNPCLNRGPSFMSLVLGPLFLSFPSTPSQCTFLFFFKILCGWGSRKGILTRWYKLPVLSNHSLSNRWWLIFYSLLKLGATSIRKGMKEKSLLKEKERNPDSC